MTEIPDELWEAARSLRNAVLWQSNGSVEPIARALMARDQRAASIARSHTPHDVHRDDLYRWSDTAETLADAILIYDDEASNDRH